MGYKDAAEILKAIAWPVTVAALAIWFRAPLVHLCESFAVKTVKLKVLGVEVELAPELVEASVRDLLRAIVASTDGLTQTEIDLFEAIQAADGLRTVKEILPGFTHDDDNDELKRLRLLRDRTLIRPLEGDRWQASKHPVLTHFGDALFRLRPQMQRQGADPLAPRM
jgi:hypothetical protein